jgi:hypothetical protein
LEALTHANCGDLLNPKGGGEGYIGSSTLLFSKKSLVVIALSIQKKVKKFVFWIVLQVGTWK